MKATHMGHCQWCNARHKLPGGRLAKHGYTVRSHFFEGACAGSGKLPIEVSCDQLQASIAAAQAQRARCLEQIARVEASIPEIERRAWLHVYHPELSSRRHGAVYRWEQHELTQLPSGAWTYRDPRGHAQASHQYGTLASIIARGKAAHLAHLRSGLGDIKAYIEHQRKRLEGWHPQPLERIDAP